MAKTDDPRQRFLRKLGDALKADRALPTPPKLVTNAVSPPHQPLGVAPKKQTPISQLRGRTALREPPP